MPAQNSRHYDSLLVELKKSGMDKSRFLILRGLFDDKVRHNTDVADSLNREMMALAKKINYEEGIIQAYTNRSALYRLRGMYDSALAILIDITPRVRKSYDSIVYADHLGDIGYLYTLKNDQKNALITLHEAMKIYQIKHGIKNLSLLYNRVGSLYQNQKQFDSALVYYNKSLQINDATGFKLGSSVNLINMGNVYEDMHDHYKAIDYYKRALKIKEEIGDKSGKNKCYNNIGMSYMNLGQVSNAISYHEKSLALAREFNSQLDIAISLINLGFDYQRGKNYHKAIEYTLSGMKIAEQINDLKLMRESARVLSECNSSLRNFEDAYRYQVMFKTYSDSIVNATNIKAIKEIQALYNVATKEKEIAELKIARERQLIQIQNMRGWVSIGIGLLLASVALVFLYYNRSRVSKKISARLKEINEMKSHFFANLSHEFRTPLTLMLGPAEKLMETASKEDKLWLELIHRNASRLLFLDEQLLEFTRLDSGIQKIHLVEGNIVVHLQSIARSFVLYAEQKQISYRCQFPESPVIMPFDPDIVEKVTANLLFNALKYTPSGGEVVVNVTPELWSPLQVDTEKKHDTRKFLKIEIGDTGPGIPEDKKALIFERFNQLNHHPEITAGGVGIGLALTKELLELHHSHIRLQSETGKGSIFRIYIAMNHNDYTNEELSEIREFLPHEIIGLTEEQAGIHQNNADLIKTAPSPDADNSKPHILVVDDNSDMRLYVRNILIDSYAVSEAPDGKEGYQLACSAIPDLIVTDVMMHPLDGIELCRLLKTDERTSHIPVIMLTALSDTQERVTGLETGADDYITKPFSNRELLTRITNLIAQRKKLRALFSGNNNLELKSISVTSADEKFLKKLIDLIEKNIDNPELEVEFLLHHIAMSRSQLHRKITGLTGESITTFIRVIRIKRAAQLFEQKFGNVSDVMYAVGFNNLSYFTKSFREVYHKTPSEFISGLTP